MKYIEIGDVKINKSDIKNITFNISKNYIETYFCNKDGELLGDILEEIKQETGFETYGEQVLKELIYNYK